MTPGQLILVILGILLVIGLFIAIRELSCWYFKINRIEKLLIAILRQLKVNGGFEDEENEIKN